VTEPAGASPPPRRKRPLHVRIFIGLAAGAIAGLVANVAFPSSPWVAFAAKYVADPVGRVFVNFITMAVVPLIFAALALGVAGLRDVSTLGRVGAKTLGYTLLVTTISVLIGVGLANAFRPGDLVDEAGKKALREKMAIPESIERAAAQSPSAVDSIVAIVPRNPVDAAARALDGQMLALMFFSLVVGVALLRVPAEKGAAFTSFLESLYAVAARIVSFGLALAPIGVFALLFSLTSKLGPDILGSLAAYALVVVAGLALQQFGVYPLLLRFLSGVSPVLFFKKIKLVMLTAFSTASSNVTLPVALEATEKELGVPRQVSSFVLTVGSTANQNGTALFEGVTVLFLAQLLGVDLSLGQQCVVVLLSVVAGIGTAGVPSGSIPAIMLLLESVGIPGVAIGIILGVNHPLDMCRTVLNVTGDVAAAVYVARSEGMPLDPIRRARST